jgi:cytochrome oxidase Cu insertion factor (SCO1/SenC/PrrC family)
MHKNLKDICPEEIDKMIRAVNLIDKVNIKDTSINPLFITVDPSRDDVNTVAKYVKGIY